MDIKLKKILLSQRVEIHSQTKERYDSLDQRWNNFLSSMGYFGIPVPNSPKIIQVFLEQTAFDGVILTGGNDLGVLGGNATERDEIEREIENYCSKNSIPLLGVCRGMQLILHNAGAKLEKIEGHAGTTHTVYGIISKTVNSYHNWGVKKPISEEFDILASSKDGCIDAIISKKRPVLGIMWHPERDEKSIADMTLIKNFFNQHTEISR